MMALPFDIGTLHFIGIGGIGMSGIAEILHNLGYQVQGSDVAENANVQRLRAMGIEVAVGQSGRQSGRAARVVVVSSAIKATNPELAAARDRFIPVVPPRRNARRADAPQVVGRRRRNPRQDHHDLADRRRARRRPTTTPP